MNKTQAVIAYIINCFQQKESPEKLGKVKLVKILWFADREFMYKYYTQITDLEYRKMSKGPMPSKINNILKSMKDEKIIEFLDMRVRYPNSEYIQQSYSCLQEPDLDMLTPQEISVLDATIAKLWNKTGKQLSDKTHDELWESIKQGDVMPVESIFLQDIIPASKDDIDG